jgi:hypothetical protein
MRMQGLYGRRALDQTRRVAGKKHGGVALQNYAALHIAKQRGGGMHRFAVLPNDIGSRMHEYNCQARLSRRSVINIWWR